MGNPKWEPYIKRAHRRLFRVFFIEQLQRALLPTAIIWFVVLLLSRFFVLVQYEWIAAASALLVFLGYTIWSLKYRPTKMDALRIYDASFPENEFITVAQAEERNFLVEYVEQKVTSFLPTAGDRFKRVVRMKFLPRAVFIAFLFLVGGTVSLLLPSDDQIEAKDVETEKEVVKELEKETKKIERKVTTPDAKKKVADLEKELKKATNAKDAWDKVTKTKKELELKKAQLLKKQKLADGKEGEAGLTSEEQKELDELTASIDALSKQMNAAQSAMAKIGQPLTTPSQLASTGSSSTQNSTQGSAQPGQQPGQTPGQGTGQQPGQGSGQGTGQQPGQGQGQGSGQGQGAGQGQGTGTGTGSGTGGTQPGQGGGQGGTAGGKGMGDRSLVAIPNRIGTPGETTTDGGQLGEGQAIGEQKGQTPVTKGTIRPYQDVIGDYAPHYRESVDRLQLPADLQNYVQSYFSSIQTTD